ncbi:glycoside hydrolase superfamily [Stachybotrys elegans]|uniref:chitinase n=1 Tax=Stachybotrys elegans TaxID=80388 RepID=A0A8K0SHJ2_9HYPO|nr:glycoside hydrolase superfamily [Stachybotrys elegans]
MNPSPKPILLSSFGLLLFLLALTPLYLSTYQAKSHDQRIKIRDGDAPSQDVVSFLPLAHSNLTRREDYTCAPGRACSNGACCGARADYCGTGCISNCDAHAECGKDSLPAGRTSPPGGSAKGQVLSRVIGYYEAWNSNSPCRRTQPSDLPLDALTHVNYAFTFLDPNTYQMTPMDASTDAGLFIETTNLKGLKPGLQVWASLAGGWTFSDNGTVTQPLLGEIARDATKRQTFANNMLSFLDTYAFDGLDIDWEYPGAPDRGGQSDDVENFVYLMRTLRETFNRSPRKLGLSFTIPASFWYLRWFDVPGLLRYADFTNIMSYDIHGTWDRDNAQGNIIRPHTNLTEIQIATELLWRVGVPPNRVSLGFGFYGRSFTLSDPSCSEPGRCRFSDGGAPGSCTGTSGYLAYYEIQDIISKNPGIVIHHDQEAAIKYMTWDENQWISFDDAETLKQKVDWANNIGFSGSLIWASDLDDNSMSAHKALTGKDIKSNGALAQQSSALFNTQILNREYGTHCQIAAGCLDISSGLPVCPSGAVMVGYDRGDCRGNEALPICCSAAVAPKSCTWRGGGLDCNGQCHKGEVNLFSSRKGGGPRSESGERKCNRGRKMFCCVDEDFSRDTESCYWAGCGRSCANGETEVAHLSPNAGCHDDDHGERLCCSTNPPALEDCHWVGQGDCADNTCAAHEVTVRTNAIGDGWRGCGWGRRKSLCCTPNSDNIEFICETQYCDLYSCPPDEHEDPNPPDDEDSPEGLTRRDEEHWLEKRVDKRSVNSDIFVDDPVLGAIWIIWRLFAHLYPGPSTLYRGRNGLPSYPNAFR